MDLINFFRWLFRDEKSTDPVIEKHLKKSREYLEQRRKEWKEEQLPCRVEPQPNKRKRRPRRLTAV